MPAHTLRALRNRQQHRNSLFLVSAGTQGCRVCFGQANWELRQVAAPRLHAAAGCGGGRGGRQQQQGRAETAHGVAALSRPSEQDWASREDGGVAGGWQGFRVGAGVALRVRLVLGERQSLQLCWVEMSEG